MSVIIAVIGIGILTAGFSKVGQLMFSDRFSRSGMGLVAFLIAVVVWVLIRPHLGAETPGHWFEKPEYTAEVEMSLFPEGSSVKNYRLPATIHAYIDGDGESSGRVYYLHSARFPNGGVLRFSDEAEVSVYGQSRVFDSQGRYWRVEIAR